MAARETQTAKTRNSDPLSAAIRAAVRDVLLELADQGVLGGQAIPRISLTPEEFGAANGWCGAKTRQLIRAGMPHMRVGAQLRVIPSEAMPWLREHGDYLADGE